MDVILVIEISGNLLANWNLMIFVQSEGQIKIILIMGKLI